ncbi:hypothetical protein [Acinetobacter thermotolerans]|uniref:hypothetical protein n=1 Tax=Acinetobacter thermotolerans TaxID=3151487 RepID=UPI00325B86B0
MLRTLHITIGIEYQQKELFEKALLDHNINFEMDGGHLPKKVSPYYKELDIIPCRYYLSGSKDWKDVINRPLAKVVIASSSGLPVQRLS